MHTQQAGKEKRPYTIRTTDMTTTTLRSHSRSNAPIPPTQWPLYTGLKCQLLLPRKGLDARWMFSWVLHMTTGTATRLGCHLRDWKSFMMSRKLLYTFLSCLNLRLTWRQWGVN